MFRYSHALTFVTVIALGSSLACAGEDKVDIETVPVGAEVALTRQDGGVVQGALTERSTETVKVSSSVGVREVPRKEIAEVQVVDKAVEAPPLPPMAKFREYTLPAGTELVVRLTTAVNSASSRVEDRVEALVSSAVTQGDATVVPEGSILKGEVTSVEPAGKVKGRASLALRFRSLTIVDHDEPPRSRSPEVPKKPRGSLKGGPGAFLVGDEQHDDEDEQQRRRGNDYRVGPTGERRLRVARRRRDTRQVHAVHGAHRGIGRDQVQAESFGHLTHFGLLQHAADRCAVLGIRLHLTGHGLFQAGRINDVALLGKRRGGTQ